MPSPALAEALALLRETTLKAQDELAPVCEACGALGGAEGELPDTPTLAGLVAELYGALGELRDWLDHGDDSPGSARSSQVSTDKALLAAEDALVAWAEGVFARK